jgi:hypothetical protein
MLRIGVDCRCFSHPKSGIARCTYEILRQLVNEGHTWYLYSGSSIDSKLNIHQKIIIKSSNWNSPLGSILWFQLKLPLLLKKIKLIFFGRHDIICHYLPQTILNQS